MKTKEIGKPLSRLEGVQKVTGSARYADDHPVADLLYGYIVNATITKGEILAINDEKIKEIPGVTAVFTFKNRPTLPWFDFMFKDMDAPPGKPFVPLLNKEILYNAQPIALVVASSFELARYAASLLIVDYKKEAFNTRLTQNLDKAKKPSKGLATLLKPLPPDPKGDFTEAYTNADFKAEMQIHHGAEHHNPLELFSTTTIFHNEDKITIYDKTQGTSNSQVYVANAFGLKYKNVRVISPFIGGGFGSGLRPQYQLFLCVMASLELKRNVKVSMDRKQMFTFGHRPQTLQNIKFGADKTGKLTAMHHSAVAETSSFEDYNEVVVNWSNMLYPCPNTQLDYKLVPLDTFTPLDMRAPGGSTGLHATESVMDDLAYQMNIDPLEYRLINYAERDDSEDKPFSSKELKECYKQAAAKFNWKDRNPKVRSQRRGNRLVGSGVSSGVWDVIALPAKAKGKINKKGSLIVESAVTDIGTGSYTIFSQIAADQLGLQTEDIKFKYGDSKLPLSPIQGGSYTTGVVGSAIKATCLALRKKLLKKAQRMENSPFQDVKLNEVEFSDGSIFVKANKNLSVTFSAIIAANKGKAIKVSKSNVPNPLKLKQYTRAAHSAAFVEVEVDEQLGVIEITKAVTAVAAGNIINPKTAKSQILGGMTWGISKALSEETLLDENMGKFINTNLGEYHIPVHADIGEMDVIFVKEKDTIINELGSKGVGEIGLVSMAPAIANAVYHATGKRVSKFPIKLDDLL